MQHRGKEKVLTLLSLKQSRSSERSRRNCTRSVVAVASAAHTRGVDLQLLHHKSNHDEVSGNQCEDHPGGAAWCCADERVQRQTWTAADEEA